MTKTGRIADLSDVFLICRTYTHAWEPVVTYVEDVGRVTIHRAVLVCEREAAAGVEDPSEKEAYSYAKGKHAGSMFKDPKYRLANGYLVEQKLGRGKQRPVARLELMERQVRNSQRKRKKGRR